MERATLWAMLGFLIASLIFWYMPGYAALISKMIITDGMLFVFSYTVLMWLLMYGLGVAGLWLLTLSVSSREPTKATMFTNAYTNLKTGLAFLVFGGISADILWALARF